MIQFSIGREEIVKYLTVVYGVVQQRHPVPILSNVLLSVEDSQLLLAATDLDIEIRTTLQVQQANAGKTTVSARKFLDICRALPSGALLNVQHKDGQLKINSGHSRFVLSTLSPDDFPITEDVDEATQLELTQGELKLLLNKTIFCMANQDVRYYLNGLLLELDEEVVRTVATDGHRLAMASLNLAASENTQARKGPRQEGEPIQSIVPRKAVLELVRLLEDSSNTVQLKFGSRHIGAQFQWLSFTSKLIDGKFPDYERVIPAGSKKQLIVDREPFKQMLTRVNILTSDKYRGVRLRLGPSRLQATVTNLEQEYAEEELAIDYEGEEFEIAFNNSYLIDALGAIDTEQVRIEFTSADSSCLISPAGESDGKYVVMPMRL